MKYWRILAIALLLGTTVALLSFFSKNKEQDLNVFYEKIPGSTRHSPDGTWWGYNQVKIARFGETVFMYVIENKDPLPAPPKFTIYKKTKEADWEKGASFPTSRPGNILVDADGTLHAFVFEAIDMVKNDSVGKLMHYWFPDAGKGDVSHFKQEVVVDNDGRKETVNIRVGAAVGSDGTLLVAFGLADTEGPQNNQTEVVYFKQKGETKWSREVAGEELGHDFYYPFALVSSKGVHLLSIQDDFVAAGKQNIYQKIMYFEKTDGVWKRDLIVDLSKHPLAKSRRSLLTQTDIYEDSDRNIHLTYKELLDPNNEGRTSAFKHLVQNANGWDLKNTPLSEIPTDMVRLIEIGRNLYFVALSGRTIVVRRVDSQDVLRFDLPPDSSGAWLYLAPPRGGTRLSEKYIDILLLNADMNNYPDAANYYVRIPKAKIIGPLR